MRRIDRQAPEALRGQVRAALDVVRQTVERDAILGAYLYGSAVVGGRRPDSDVDLFVVASRRLTADEKRRIVDGLLPISGRATRPAAWRPLEVTVVARPDVVPWRYPPRVELQYGEWLRDRFVAGDVEPSPPADPDLAVLITMVRASSVALSGPPAAALLHPVPSADLVRAMVDGLDPLLGDLDSDTRNVILTLARMWSTVATGDIRSKDAAADWALSELPAEHRPVLFAARDLYLRGGYGTWDDLRAVRAHADYVAARVRELARPGRSAGP